MELMQIAELTERELEVLTLITDGLNNQQIAEKMMVSIHTVKAHICSIFAKLKVNSRVQAAVKAVKFGLVE